MKGKQIEVWICDYCGKEYKTKKLCDRHELKCPKRTNKEMKIVINLGKINQKNIFNFVLLFLLSYFFLFSIVNSYAKSNNLPQRYLLKPLGWFAHEEATIKDMLTPTPTDIITPTLVTKPNINNLSINQIECIGPDGKQFQSTMDECTKLNQQWGKQVEYMMNCKVPSDCGGGIVYIKKSECDTRVCCQHGDSWTLVSSNQECESLQNANKSGSKQEYNDNKIYFTTKHSYASGTRLCYESAVNRLLQDMEDGCQVWYQSYQDNCESGKYDKFGEDCKKILERYENNRKDLSNYVTQFCD